LLVKGLLIFLRNTIGLEDGRPGAAMTIHTFGNYAEKFHPHIHAIVSDGLFRETGTFYVMPDVDLKPLEEKIISFITEHQIIKKILEHLRLWEQKASRDPPKRDSSPENPVLESLDRGNELIYEPFYEDWSGYEEPSIL